ncbi:spindle assembly checkpoint component MAD1-like [Melanaphis sacchari]|uniref:spindle assembly checkpoint component MAD1-like n=1 Tax=Melanaphis sacchari TaxID=742174 RepID=UPI000DC12EBA|nr:spindle assembly checkpoint component MAD1-like [Melanaphis sacchari]
MNDSLSNNEDLHQEFKTLLIKIEPYYVALKSDLEKLLCREWLHKLFKTTSNEESLRNAYLIKLLEQLEKGKLKEPFNNLPKHNSPLLPLTTHNFPKQKINVCDKKNMKPKDETLIMGMVNVQNTVGAFKSAENHTHTNEIKDNYKISEQGKQLDIDEIVDDSKEVNFFVNESSIQRKRLDANEMSDDSKEVQQQKLMVDKSEGGDGLTLNVETKLKLESIEKMSKELKKKTELLAEQLQEIELQADKNVINNDQLTVLNAELNKYKNDLENMRNLEAADELCASKLLKNILDKTTVLDNNIVSEMNRLKTMLEDAFENKKIMNFAMEQLKEEHRLKMNKKDKFHAELNRKLMLENSQLKECMGEVE